MQQQYLENTINTIRAQSQVDSLYRPQDIAAFDIYRTTKTYGPTTPFPSSTGYYVWDGKLKLGLHPKPGTAAYTRNVNLGLRA